MNISRFTHFFILFILSLSASAQNNKPKSYVVFTEDYYTINIKENNLAIDLFAQEKIWVGDKDDNRVKGNRINFTAAFEEVSDIEAYSISPEKKKTKVKRIFTQDVEIENIFYHDMKYKYYFFEDLKEGSETYSSYRKTFKKPQFLDNFYFKGFLDCKSHKITLKVSNAVEIGYLLHGNETDKIKFSTSKEGDYTLYTWQMLDSEKQDVFAGAPEFSYYAPHLIFYIKNYKNTFGTHNVLGSVDNLYNFYYETVKDINKADQSELKRQTLELIKDKQTDFEKAKAIFNYVQGKVNYVAFEDGMGGFIPREAADVFQKKYGDCKDMANLLNEMLTYAGIESHIAWIGTRHNNYKYENVPTPIVDNHMIAVAKINNEYLFLDATGQYTLFPGFTSFIQGKEALLKIDEKNYKILPVPEIAPEENNTKGKMEFQLQGNKLVGKANFGLTGFTKSQFLYFYKASSEPKNMLKSYLASYIQNIETNNILVENDDISTNPLALKYDFEIDKWVKIVDDQILFKPILFFPFSDSRIDTEKRNVPYEFDFKKSYNFEYEFTIPEGYSLDFVPDNLSLNTDLVKVDISYAKKNNKLIINQKMSTNILLLEKSHFEAWNSALKTITKQYNQNIIFVKQ